MTRRSVSSPPPRRPTCTAASSLLLEGERSRFTDRLDAAAVDPDAGTALRAAVQDIEDAR